MKGRKAVGGEGGRAVLRVPGSPASRASIDSILRGDMENWMENWGIDDVYVGEGWGVEDEEEGKEREEKKNSRV